MENIQTILSKIPSVYGQTPNLHTIICLDFSGSMGLQINAVKSEIYKYYKFKDIFNTSISLILFSDYERNTPLNTYFKYYPNIQQNEFENILDKIDVWGGGGTLEELSLFTVVFAQFMHAQMYPDNKVMLNINVITDENCRTSLKSATNYQAIAEKKLLLSLSNEINPINHIIFPNTPTFIAVLGMNRLLNYFTWETDTFKYKHLLSTSELVPVMLEILYSVFIREPLTEVESELYQNPPSLLTDSMLTMIDNIKNKVNAPKFKRDPIYYGHLCDFKESIRICLNTNTEFKRAMLEVFQSNNSQKLSMNLLQECYSVFKYHHNTRKEIDNLLNEHANDTKHIVKVLQSKLYEKNCCEDLLCSICLKTKNSPDVGCFMYTTDYRQELGNLNLLTNKDVSKLQSFVTSLCISETRPALNVKQYRYIDGDESGFQNIINILDKGIHHATITENSIKSELFKHMLVAKFGTLAIPGVCDVDYDKIFTNQDGHLNPLVYGATYTDLRHDENLPKTYKDILTCIHNGLLVRSFDFMNEIISLNSTPEYYEVKQPGGIYCTYCSDIHPHTFFYNTRDVRPLPYKMYDPVHFVKNYVCIKGDFDSRLPVICMNQIYQHRESKNKTFFKCYECEVLYYVENNSEKNINNNVKSKCPSCANDVEQKQVYVCDTHGKIWNGFHKNYYTKECILCLNITVKRPIKNFKIFRARRVDTLSDEELKQYLIDMYCPQLKCVKSNYKYATLWDNTAPSLYIIYKSMGIDKIFEHWIKYKNISIVFNKCTLDIDETACQICTSKYIILQQLCKKCKSFYICQSCFIMYVKNKITNLRNRQDDNLTLKCLKCMNSLVNWVSKLNHLPYSKDRDYCKDYLKGCVSK